MKLFKFLFAALVGTSVSTAAFLWLAAGEIYDYQDSFQFERDAGAIDVVVVLAGGKNRIPVAVEVWNKIRMLPARKKDPVLFLSGVGANGGLETLSAQGVPEGLIQKLNHTNFVTENVSENTFENAQLFASFARQKEWKHALLMTTSYHMRRADFILRKALDHDVRLYTETVDAEHFGRNEWHKNEYSVRVTLIEYFKWLYYRKTY